MGDSEQLIEYTPEELAEINKAFEAIESFEMPRRFVASDVQSMPAAREHAHDEMIRPTQEEEIVDITEDIEEIEEESAEKIVHPEMEEEFSAELGEVPEIDTGEPAVVPQKAKPEESFEEIPSFEEEGKELPSHPPEKRTQEEITTLDELEALTKDDYSIDSHEELVADEKERERAETVRDISLESAEVENVPDLSDLSLQSDTSIQEARDGDIPEIDLSSIPDISTVEETVPPAGDAGVDDIHIDSFHEELTAQERKEPLPSTRRTKKDEDVEDIDFVSPVRRMDEITEVAETMEIPAVDEEEERPTKRKPERREEKDELELSDRELKKIKTAVSLYHPNLRKAVIQAIVEDLLSVRDQRQLIDMILASKGEDAICRFLEKKLNRTIDISEIPVETKRKVIAARQEYTREGLERQKQLVKFTKIFGVAALATCVIAILLFQFVYKPAMAKRKIREGVALIREPGIPPYQRLKNFEKAENIFKIVDEDYVKDYIPGYNAYARAYFDVKEYAFSYQKLKKAYELSPGNLETLNNLGFFYSRIPEKYYQDNYRTIIPPDKKEPDRSSRLDVAIRFYRYALLRDPHNVTSLYGIGNAYLFQGRYFEARKYYEDILKRDIDSVVGNSGLLNLFIERDDFPEVVTLHAQLKDRDILEKLDPALLAKLAWYYLTKKTTEKVNVRVDYGLKSERFTDIADNPYPAVKDILNTLAEHHPEYPPLYLHKALLARDTGNYKMMRDYLELALKKEPNYYGARHLLGEYHLIVKEPADAYRELKAALKAYQSPPEFTFNDFYKETENLGRTYGLIGNVFYYYFDKVRARFKFADELEEVVIDSELEKRAIAAGDRSPEVYYNLGRLYYMRGLYNKSLEMWLNLYDEFISKPELMLALGNAFYKMNNLESGKGEYLRLISVLEHMAESVPVPSVSKQEHVKLYRTLSSAYNNLGVIY
ncbi:MAG: tetratricopeptide repeat protein, partial [Spirochaetes bacterium]|nr:tetratricopeptide repeat protein [Spirochaetota bacterium]